MAEYTASIKIRAEDRSSAALDKVARGSKKLEERLAGMRGELAALEKKDSSIKKFRALKTDLGRAESALDRAKARTADLGRQMKAAEAPTAKLRKEFDASRRKSGELAASHRKQREQLHSLRSELRKAGVHTRGMERMGRAAMRIPAALDAPGTRPPRRGGLGGGYLRDVLRGKGWGSLPGRAWESLKGLPQGTKIGGAIGALDVEQAWKAEGEMSRMVLLLASIAELGPQEVRSLKSRDFMRLAEVAGARL